MNEIFIKNLKKFEIEWMNWSETQNRLLDYTIQTHNQIKIVDQRWFYESNSAETFETNSRLKN